MSSNKLNKCVVFVGDCLCVCVSMIGWVLLIGSKDLVTLPNSPESSLTLTQKLCSEIMPNGLTGAEL